MDRSEAEAFIMSPTVEVSLISGKTVSLQTHEDESVDSLRVRAQRALGAGKGRLLDSTGSVLDGGASLKKARLQYAAWRAQPQPLTFQVRRVDILGSKAAFAAILGDGSVATWGDARKGGDSSAVRDQLKNVQQIQATDRAFAAILGDGSVLAWGQASSGGHCWSAICDQLKNVHHIQATRYAFAAILGDGCVVTWGDVRFGGNSTGVRDQLKNVRQIQATDEAFAAIRGDGSVVTWGFTGFGGDSGAVQCQLKKCAANSSKQGSLCCNSGGWFRHELGPCWKWW